MLRMPMRHVNDWDPDSGRRSYIILFQQNPTTPKQAQRRLPCMPAAPAGQHGSTSLKML